ncbi:MAG: ATP-binding protein [Sulfurimonas sp.]|uniref:AAA family ATPase n=1 Tax=Sulfurimonas sp. TaxID=2022749 RepID=UPI0026079790|nr:ATP-binding protein [Sulfurimonas sp.]MDD5372713.1 ATP-binding protein [Sulfurimonas sp.]
MISNPFYYGGAVKKEHFCNRVSEIKELKSDINAGLNTLIYAPRRFGKTSFVLKALDELKEQNIKYVFLDLMYLSTIDEFINKYFNVLAKSLEEPTDKVVNFFKSILKIRPNINVNFDAAGTPSFSLALNSEDKTKALEDVLNIPLSFAESGQKIVVVFDEFQEISNLELEAKLRSIIQYHSDKVAYIFMGSKKSMLHAMFLDKNRPFYKSVKHFKIKEIKEESWSEFIISKFAKTHKEIEQRYISKIVEFTKGFPYYTQQFAYELWNSTQNQVDDVIFEKTLKMILEREEDLFAVEWDNITQNQKKALKIIIGKNGKNLYDEQYLAKYQIKTGSFQTALKGLIQKDIIDKTADGYYFQDPLFEFWVSGNR